jgi:hypothetical protein
VPLARDVIRDKQPLQLHARDAREKHIVHVDIAVTKSESDRHKVRWDVLFSKLEVSDSVRPLRIVSCTVNSADSRGCSPPSLLVGLIHGVMRHAMALLLSLSSDHKLEWIE